MYTWSFLMSKDRPVTIRLSSDDYLEYELMAIARGMKISPFLRELLQQHKNAGQEALKNIDHTLREMNEVLASVEESIHHQNEAVAVASDQNILLEILLLLRSVSKPEVIKQVQGQLKTISLIPFTL